MTILITIRVGGNKLWGVDSTCSRKKTCKLIINYTWCHNDMDFGLTNRMFVTLSKAEAKSTRSASVNTEGIGDLYRI